MYCEIKTARLLLRPLTISDSVAVHEYASDHDNTRYMMLLPRKTVDETTEFLTRVTKEWEKSEPIFYEFAIVLNGVLIGQISIYLNEDKSIGELGWIINKRYQKMGYATESAHAIKDFAFNSIHLKKIIAQCDHRNVPSRRIMERIGLKLENADGMRTYVKKNETARELTYSLTVDRYY